VAISSDMTKLSEKKRGLSNKSPKQWGIIPWKHFLETLISETFRETVIMLKVESYYDKDNPFIFGKSISVKSASNAYLQDKQTNLVL